MNGYPIIIGGFYRTGTSLLRRLLDSHSNIHCGPEVKFFKDFYGDYRNDGLAHVRLFSTLRTLGLDETEMLEPFGKAFIRCHELAAKKFGKIRWADKNPENVLYLEQWHRLLDGRFYFIHIIRYLLDALASLQEVGFQKAVPVEFSEKVRLYHNFTNNALRFGSSYLEITLTVRYEDLVQNTQQTLDVLIKQTG